MAHDGSGIGWDEAAPADADMRKFGALEIRDLRRSARLRLQKEHDTPAAATVGGEHKSGSAKAYSIDDAVAKPTLRPDGTTVFTAGDRGRLLVEGNKLHHRSTAAWVPVSGLMDQGTVTCPSDGSFSAWVDQPAIPRVIILDGPNGVNFTVRGFDGVADCTASQISGVSVIGVAYQVSIDHAGKRFRMRQHPTATQGNGGAFRYATIADE